MCVFVYKLRSIIVIIVDLMKKKKKKKKKMKGREIKEVGQVGKLSERNILLLLCSNIKERLRITKYSNTLVN